MSGISLITRGFVGGSNGAVIVKPIVPFEVEVGSPKIEVVVKEPDKIVVTLKED